MNEQLQRIINHPATIPAAVGVVCFSAGIGLGHILWNRKKGELHSLPVSVGLDTLMDEEVSYPPVVRPKPVIVDAETYEQIASETLEEEVELEVHLDEDSLEEALEGVVVEATEEDELIAQNVFAGNDDDWNYEEEKAKRNGHEPHILHKDEFYADELDYTQKTLTYFAGDDIMVDEEDVPVYNYANVTGPLTFGHGSGDSNVLYVRNHKLKAEYEILRSDGMYAVEILGLEAESSERARDLKHSRDQRFRPDD